MKHLCCIGLGYSARALARLLLPQGWRVSGTSRTVEGVEKLKAEGFEAVPYAGDGPGAELAALIRSCTHLLLSAPAEEGGDPVLAHHRDDIAAANGLEWIGYLSTVGVYGNYDGGRVDETSELRASSPRTLRRVEAERQWLALGAETGRPVQVFRLSGIYGPGRSAVDNLRAGRARRIVKPGQIFNRIHVEDIARVLEASIARPRAGAVYNVTDDEPSPAPDVIAYAAGLIGMEPPPEVPFEEAGLTPMARSFYGENKRVANDLVKRELGVTLRYPSYREGIAAIAAAEKR
ncbi:MAG: SDR family oxidoreductase [Hyphomicrobiales bacterium]